MPMSKILEKSETPWAFILILLLVELSNCKASKPKCQGSTIQMGFALWEITGENN